MARFLPSRLRRSPANQTTEDLDAGPVWLDRLVYGSSASDAVAAPDDQSGDETMQVLRPRGPWGVGLRDAVAGGWFDADSGELVPGVRIGSDDVVVDFGCGEGNLLQFCAAQGAAVIGIDNHQDTLASARKRLADHQAEFHLYPDAGPLPVTDNAATVVLCTEVLEHVPDPQRVLAELVRIGKPGARYVISVPAAESEELTRRQAPASYFEVPNHINVFTQDDFVAMVEAAGLTVEAIQRGGFFWSVWFALHWHTGVSATNGHHPVLDLWTATWDQLLSSPGGGAAKAALDDSLPKYQLIVARSGADDG